MPLSPWESASFWLLWVFGVLWVFVLGANFGSFLNVVVYRLPRRMPLVFSVSRCPRCGNRIAVRDNIPLLGWLLLRGRCRVCGERISPRYPLVEGALGAVFLLLFCLELLGGGGNLPAEYRARPGMFGLIEYTDWRLVGACCAHCCLLFFLLGAALMESDGQTPPKRFVLAGLLAALAFSSSMPLPWKVPPDEWMNQNPWLAALTNAGMGLACAALLAMAWRCLYHFGRRFIRTTGEEFPPDAIPAALLLIGPFLGWQATTSIALAAAAILPAFALAAYCLHFRRPPHGFVIALLTLLQIVFWKSLWQQAERVCNLL